MIQWDITDEDMDLIEKIMLRIQTKYTEISPLAWCLDISAVHSNGCPLKLAELLNAKDSDFFHDVFGIRKNLNRETGKLENDFLPRFAA